MSAIAEVKALAFDVFGTVVNWRTGITEEGRAFGREKGIDVDWEAFADAWRGRYQPSMSRVREGEIPWTNLDSLHRASLDALLEEFAVTGLDEREKDHLNRAWHRLPPWPDSVEGLTRLKRRYVIATLSNGNVALLVNMAKNAGLPWDAVLGAEVARHYKPQPQAYLVTAELLGLAPHECMLVAAHNDDLVAAGTLGFRTAFVPRPSEYGPDQKTDLEAEHEFDLVAASFVDLAEQLGC
ncbi:MAG: haloacid dehalogenase type II [Gammaproteobacteria bacterium]|nr:haloacid dehalogenase type II [Gammaproteobacteria bacterium]NIM74418.1 haloacid dehalogenase type II [Gammaproteobacteria bacterium]NIO26189.1 haloacid dehalogenase type II [Gammaproteobacteria bacterium]NIO66803.1 haloacid dehalogenase type II [Gammaproteobacteria bacterium]NIP46115.1 haloacid dehalogenase type II [Gammaproteobacteria bacterium]